MTLVLNGTSGVSSVDGSASTPAIQGNDSNTGVFFPAADTVAIATGGVEAVRVNGSGNLQFNSGYGSVATAYGCRAWVNFNGTGTVAIRASGNVSSITDNGVGDYTVNFTTAMPDANYAATVVAGEEAVTLGLVSTSSTSPTASAYRFRTTTTASTTQDSGRVMAAIFR